MIRNKRSKSEIGRLAVKKGKAWELKIAKRLEELLGVKFVRTRAQEKYLKVVSGDIVCVDKSTFYFQDLSFQIKAIEHGQPFEWLKKATDDAEGKKPIIIWQKRNEPTMVLMNLKDLALILFEINGYREQEKNR